MEMRKCVRIHDGGTSFLTPLGMGNRDLSMGLFWTSKGASDA